MGLHDDEFFKLKHDLDGEPMQGSATGIPASNQIAPHNERQIDIQAGDVSIEITGTDDIETLQMKAAHLLLIPDLEERQEEDPTVWDKYFMSIMEDIGYHLQGELGYPPDESNLKVVRDYLDTLISRQANEDEDYHDFLDEIQL